jgi:hypothetical protein
VFGVVAGFTAAGTGQVALVNARSTSGDQAPALGRQTQAINVPSPAGIAWAATIPVQRLTRGVPVSINLNDYITPDAGDVTRIGGAALPSGLSLNRATGVVSGTPDTNQAPAGVTLRADTAVYNPGGGGIDYQAEFNAIKALGTTFYANDFDFATRAELMASAASARYGYVGAPSGESTLDPPPAAEKVGLDAGVKLTGRGSLLLRFRNGLENLTQNGPAYHGSFGGVGVKSEGPAKDVFFFRYILRFNAKWLATPHSGGTSTKHMILSGVNRGFVSGQHGFCTINSDPRFPTCWLVRPAFEILKTVFPTNPPGAGDHCYQPFLNLGPQGSGGADDTNSLAWFQRRYGPTRRERWNWSAIADLANFPTMFRADRWYVMEHKVSKPADEIKLWIAEAGQQPILFAGALNAGIPSSFSYTGFQAILRPTDGTNQAFTGDDLTQHIDQFLASSVAIPFPGGYALPYAGDGEAPPGYPYLGSSEE